MCSAQRDFNCADFSSILVYFMVICNKNQEKIFENLWKIAEDFLLSTNRSLDKKYLRIKIKKVINV